jgi:dolichol-phosphate mannosyltransferase
MHDSEKHDKTQTALSDRPLLSIVVAFLNEQTNINHFLEVLMASLQPLGVSYELILVDDGSDDDTWNLIRAASATDRRIKGISLSRNFGHQSALFAGLSLSSGQACVTMDGDLQHPPQRIGELLQAWREGFRIVETRRLDSEDFSVFKRFSSRIFNGVFSFLSGLPLTPGISDYRLLDRRVVDVVIQMGDSSVFLRGMTHWVGYRSKTVVYRASERYSGRTKWTWSRLMRYSLSSIVAFSLKPLRIGIWIGFITSLFAFLELAYIIYRYFHGIDVPGWASTLTVISFMFGMLFILVGILGTYMGTMVEILKKRPRFLIGETCGQFIEK